MRTGSALIAAAAALLTAGCSLFVPRLETPRLTVVSIELGKSNFLTQHLTVRLRVENPNDRALPVRALSYTLEVAGEEAAHGVSNAAFTVPPNGAAQFDMDVTANLAGTLLRLLLANGAHSGEVDYHLMGRVELARGMLRSIPFDERGSFTLR
ncbi:MAG TPA: LEA type 2 family protein [Steroidobacteraceae bacterium]|nr:LEA type 2 family protein [Steroidobacteraceae bacterium]